MRSVRLTLKSWELQFLFKQKDKNEELIRQDFVLFSQFHHAGYYC